MMFASIGTEDFRRSMRALARVPAIVVFLFVLFPGCGIGCLSPVKGPPDPVAGMYAAELLECVAAARTADESRFCRAAVDCKYHQPTCKELR